MSEWDLDKKVEYVNEQIQLALQSSDQESADKAAVRAFRAMRRLKVGLECLRPVYQDEAAMRKASGVQ